MKLIKKIKVNNPLGLHIRPAATIVKLLQNTKSKVFFTYKKQTINAKSIMSILILAAKKNAKITITIEGSDANAVMTTLTNNFENGFGEKEC
ncbi:MAG: Phosphocarrier protein HPr [Candidatus Anoxychlamydiales bacterium]|nr:Phosphocarrier protein HPr [Candidatus Anoxychlamydiales bacterium]